MDFGVKVGSSSTTTGVALNNEAGYRIEELGNV
jgi:hypothetical protein